MKKTLFLGLFMLLISCSSDNEGNSTDGNILGKWMFYKYYERDADYVETGFFNEDCPSKKDYVEHKSNGELVVNGHHDEDCSAFITEGSWEKSEDLLIHTENGIHGTEIFKYEILTLNSSVLKVREINENEDEDYEFIITFKRM